LILSAAILAELTLKFHRINALAGAFLTRSVRERAIVGFAHDAFISCWYSTKRQIQSFWSYFEGRLMKNIQTDLLQGRSTCWCSRRCRPGRGDSVAGYGRSLVGAPADLRECDAVITIARRGRSQGRPRIFFFLRSIESLPDSFYAQASCLLDMNL
jgi:hypothetical protein